jgi:hypothetical protein
VARPENWLQWVHQPLTAAELKEVRQSINRGTTFSLSGWLSRIAAEFDLTASLKSRGRPRKEKETKK